MTDEKDDNQDNSPLDNSEEDEGLLKEIRDRFTYASEKWRDIREQSQLDRRYIAGNPWTDKDRKARDDAGRPCLNHDELNQYVHRAVNNARQNPKGIKIDPFSGSDKDAELRQDIVRTAEYRSHAPDIYLAAYQAMLEGSYGFFGVSRRYVANENLTPENFNQQEIWFRAFANPDAVLPDPDCKEPDWSDQGYSFVLDPVSRDEFKRRFKKARITDFSDEYMRIAKDWVGGQNVLLAEYWKVVTTERPVYLVDGKIVYTVPKGRKPEYERVQKQRRVVQYLTNGVEILKKNPQPGTMIPIIPIIGLERYLDEGGVPKRVLYSLVRLGRDPQMSLAYLVTLEAEEAGLTPKVPYVGYVGQFETDAEAWDNITKQPRAKIQVDPIVDASTGQVLPLPTRQPFAPNFAAYEVAKDSARRAIQASMGITPLPTAAQRDNEKSGVALGRIEAAQDLGSFHFVAGFKRGMAYAGRVANEYVTEIHAEEQQMMLRKPDDSHRRVVLNTDQPYLDPETQEMTQHVIEDADHTVTVSDGPSYNSQREAISEFIDTLLENLPKLPIPPPVQQKILAMAIQMKELGPRGDQLAELIAPPDQPQQIPPEAQQAIAQAHQVAQLVQAELAKLQQEKAGRVVDNEYKLQLEQMKIEAQIAVAEINTKAQSLSERLQFVEDAWKQLHGQAHEAGLQAQEHAHAAGLAQQQQEAAAEQQQQQPQAEPESGPEAAD